MEEAMRYMRLLCLFFAFAFPQVAGGGSEPVEVVVRNGFACRDMKHALSLLDAFARSEEHGWRRAAIEIGRSRRFESLDSAIAAGICVYREEDYGKALFKSIIKDLSIITYQRQFAVAAMDYRLHVVLLGPYYWFELPGKMPEYIRISYRE